jgi:hypothetical protein
MSAASGGYARSDRAVLLAERIMKSELMYENIGSSTEFTLDELKDALHNIIERFIMGAVQTRESPDLLGALDPARAFRTMQMVQVEREGIGAIEDFMEVIRTSGVDDMELIAMAKNIHGGIAACREAHAKVEIWASKILFGCSAEDTAVKSDFGGYVEVGIRLLDVLRARRYRLTRSTYISDKDFMSGDLCREVRAPGTNIGAHAWERVPHPDPGAQEFYSLREFVIRETAIGQNPELHKLLKGDCVDGQAEKVVKWLRNSPHTSFPIVRMHRHSFAFTDGVYIGFMHDSTGAETGQRYKALWEAVENGRVQALNNFVETGSNAALRFTGHMYRAFRGRRIAADIWISHNDARTLLPSDFIVSRYIAQPGRDAMRVRLHGPHAWEQIETKCIDFVLKWQFGDPGVSEADRGTRARMCESNLGCPDIDKIYRDVSRVWWWSMGRTLFPSDQYVSSGAKEPLFCKLDTAQFAPMMIGKARCGKSQLGMTIAELIPPHEVGNLGNQTEPQFWGQKLYDKRMVVALECKKSMNFDPANLQNMISGEMISVARKNQDPWMGNWQAPLIIAANEMPLSWDDSQGQISNRMLIFKFEHGYVPPKGFEPPFHSDLHVAVHGSPEVAAMVRKLYCAHLLNIDKNGGRSNYFTDLPAGYDEESVLSAPQDAFDDCVLPKPFFAWRSKYRRDMDSLRTFFLDPKFVVFVDTAELLDLLKSSDMSTGDARRALSILNCVSDRDITAHAKRFMGAYGTRARVNAINNTVIQQAVENYTRGHVVKVKGRRPAYVINSAMPADGEEFHLLRNTKQTASQVYYQGMILRSVLDRAAGFELGQTSDEAIVIKAAKAISKLITGCKEDEAEEEQDNAAPAPAQGDDAPATKRQRVASVQEMAEGGPPG